MQRQKIGIAGAGADDMGDAQRRQPAAGGVELAQGGAAGAGLVAARTSRAAGPSTSRRQKARRRAGSTISALAWARKVAPAAPTRRMRSGSTASMRPRRMRRQGRRGAAGRDRHHDLVAVDDRRQDEIAERRPVGHVHRHAEPPWRRAGPSMSLIEIAGGDEHGGGAASGRRPRRPRSCVDRGAGRTRQIGAPVGGRRPRPPPRLGGRQDRRTAADASRARRPAAAR